MIGVINSAWKDEVVKRTSSAFEPSQDTGAGRFKEARTERRDESSAV
jgi:hypothetical protein